MLMYVPIVYGFLPEIIYSYSYISLTSISQCYNLFCERDIAIMDYGCLVNVEPLRRFYLRVKVRWVAHVCDNSSRIGGSGGGSNDFAGGHA